MQGNYITHKEKEYVRISHVLSFFKEKINVDYRIWDNKTQIGTDVHKAIESDLKGTFNVLQDGGLNYFDSYKVWKKELDSQGASYEKKEFRLYDDDRGISGAFDLLMSHPDTDLPALVDFKTSYAVDKKFWPLQGCFYYQLCIKNKIKVSPTVCFIKLDRKGGKPIIKNYEITIEIEEVANSMLDIFLYLQKYRYYVMLVA